MSNPTTSPKERFIKLSTQRWLSSAYLFRNLPSAFFSGVRVKALDEEESVVSVPYTWFSRNPFGSTYFACLAMGGELSTGMLAMLHAKGGEKKVSMLVLEMEAKYHKKATGLTQFICRDGRLLQAALQYAEVRGQPQTCKAYTVGIDKEGACVAEFWITWSFKLKD
jgi:hypothetical protein